MLEYNSIDGHGSSQDLRQYLTDCSGGRQRFLDAVKGIENVKEQFVSLIDM
jgi:hypothetical protein